MNQPWPKNCMVTHKHHSPTTKMLCPTERAQKLTYSPWFDIYTVWHPWELPQFTASKLPWDIHISRQNHVNIRMNGPIGSSFFFRNILATQSPQHEPYMYICMRYIYIYSDNIYHLYCKHGPVLQVSQKYTSTMEHIYGIYVYAYI